VKAPSISFYCFSKVTVIFLVEILLHVFNVLLYVWLFHGNYVHYDMPGYSRPPGKKNLFKNKGKIRENKGKIRENKGK
jgi:hypothetical protein